MLLSPMLLLLLLPPPLLLLSAVRFAKLLEAVVADRL